MHNKIVSFTCLIIALLFASCAWNTKTGAIMTSRDLVEKVLRAPTTASFSNEKVLDRRGDLFLVQLTVDAENAFGAKIRSHFLVILEMRKDGKYYSKPQVATQEFDHEPTTLDIASAKSINGWDDWNFN